MNTEPLKKEHDNHAVMNKKTIWKVFFILFFLTALEFILALAVPTSIMSQDVKNFFYIILTLFKAFYIVAYFMHMKFENKFFQRMIILNMGLIVYLLVLILIEAVFVGEYAT